MRPPMLRRTRITLALFLIFPLASIASGQSGSTPSRITQSVNEEVRVTLHGNTHPLARAEFDRGAAADDLSLHRMLLLLRRSPEQESALARLLVEQQVRSSSNYHNWLTPEQFGQQFGPSDSDLHAVTSWLASQGITVDSVAAGRAVIEFSGTAGQVRRALRTDIHKFEVNGEERWANADDPSIPEALAPVVGGVVSLNNFPRKPLIHTYGTFGKSAATGQYEPLYTLTFQGKSFYILGPTDFATIYNVLPLWKAGIDGTGQTIAIVGQTDVQWIDHNDFRSMWNLTGGFFNIIYNGPNPGIQFDETEADADTQWAGAVAKGANIDLVVSESTETTAGIDLSALYIVDNNLAPVMSESYGSCEQDLGAAGNAFLNALWEQGAAQGITVVVASGDSGSDVCDYGTAFGNGPYLANHGLSVSGNASTPFNVAVGGTDFADAGVLSTYWSTSNAYNTNASAKSYIPESTWSNSACARAGSPACASWGDSYGQLIGGSGGASNCAHVALDSSCAAGYAKPAWQTGLGVPSDSVRDLPDVSLFAAAGSTTNTFYPVCQADVMPPGVSCNLNAFLTGGGTSVSAPAFAGIMAMVVQKTGERQGNPNFVLYTLAARSGASCASNSTAVANTQCVFYDIVKGNNSVACQAGSPNCGSSTSTGILVDPKSASSPAWITTPGFDRATGLGSVNAANLVNQWSSVTFNPTTTTLALSTSPPTTPLTVVHGQPVDVTVTVTSPGGTPTGDIALLGGRTNSTAGIDFKTLSGGSFSGPTIFLSGGTYNVTAHYPGNGAYGASDSAPVQVTVTPEATQTRVGMVSFDINGYITSTNATSLVYGSPYILRVDVLNAAGNPCAPAVNQFGAQGNPVFGCPTGTVSVTDNGRGLDQFTYDLNSQGYLEDQPIQLDAGSHSIYARYFGDYSFTASTSATDAVTVAQAPTYLNITAPSSVGAGDSFTLTATVTTNSNGASPAGNVQFYYSNSGNISLGSAYCQSAAPSSASAYFATCVATLTNATLPQTAIVTAQYAGDGNYLSSTANGALVNVTPEFSLVPGAASLTILSPGQSASTTITMSEMGGAVGTVSFTCLVPFNMAGGGCALSPSSVTNSGSTQLTVTTAAPTVAAPPGSSFRVPPGWFVIAWAAAIFCALLLFGPRRKLQVRLALSLAVLALLVGSLVECGGSSSPAPSGSPGTPAGTYTISVTGSTTTGLNHTVSVSVTVQ